MSGTPIVEANIAPSKNDVVLAIIQKELAGKSVFFPLVQDVTRFAKKGMKTITFLKRSVVNAIDKDCHNANPTQTFALTADTLNLDLKPYVSFTISDCDELESVVNLDGEAAKAAASAIQRHVDDALTNALIAGAGFTSTQSTLNRDAVLEMIEYVDCNFSDDHVLVASCKLKYGALLKEAEFTQADVFGSPVIKDGTMAALYGVPLVFSKRLPVDQALCFDKNSICIGFQRGVKFRKQACNEYGADAWNYTWDAKYGVKILQENELGAGVGKSPWISKLN
jgi:hypothetical protein